MAIFKCKMCGGDLTITNLEKVVECDFCGTTQTVPTADNEKKLTLFNRGNTLIRNARVEISMPEGMTILMFRDTNFASWFPWGVTRAYYDERLHLHFTDRKVKYIDEVLRPYADKSYVPGTLMYTVEEAERVNQIKSDIRDYCNRKGVEWVMGTADIDAEWDSYLSELKAMGLDDYLKHTQAAYDRFVQNMAKYN